ncbi:MAG: hypothetical protein Q9163_000677 [Psora crenata]
MSSNVGLSTPRGSGTSGYVQRNLSHLKPRDDYAPYPKDYEQLQHKQRKPDEQILNHDRLREIEVKVFELQDRLEDEGVGEEEIEAQTEALRAALTKADGDRKGSKGLGQKGGKERQFKPHQVHEQAEAKIAESERLRRALGISKGYEEGSHWKKGEERLREGLRREER